MSIEHGSNLDKFSDDELFRELTAVEKEQAAAFGRLEASLASVLGEGWHLGGFDYREGTFYKAKTGESGAIWEHITLEGEAVDIAEEWKKIGQHHFQLINEINSRPLLTRPRR